MTDTRTGVGVVSGPGLHLVAGLFLADEAPAELAELLRPLLAAD